MRIIEHDWKWAKPLAVRSGAPLYLVVHHAAGDVDAEAIHRIHLNKGWAGVGYHYVVQLDGSVHRGCPENRVGTHCLGYNSVSLGVCFSGNYEVRKTMPPKQFEAGRELLADLRRRYPKAKVRKHRDMPGNATVCPGRYFPFDDLLKETAVATSDLVETGKRALLKQRMLWYALRNDLSLDGVTGKLTIIAKDGTPSNGWGEPAKKLAWRVSGHLKGVKQSTQPTKALMKALDS